MPRLAKQPSEAQLAARAAGAERLKAATAQRLIAAGAPEIEAPEQSQAQDSAVPRRYTHPVRSRRRDFDAGSEKVGQDKTRHMKSHGPARRALEPTVVEPVESPVPKIKLEALRFNEDIITIVVHDSTNPTDEPFPEVWNDGVVQRFQRGKEMQVKRKYVEVLARAKRTTRGNEKYKDANGDDAYRYPAHSALRYPFSVLHDPSPRGRAWLSGILQEG